MCKKMDQMLSEQEFGVQQVESQAIERAFDCMKEEMFHLLGQITKAE